MTDKPDSLQPNDPTPFSAEDFEALGIPIPAKFAATPAPGSDEALLAAPPVSPEVLGALQALSQETLQALPKETQVKVAQAIYFAKLSEQVRQTVVKVLEKQWPAAFARYREIKYPTPGTEPSLEQRRAAYEFAFRAFLRLTYLTSFAGK